MIFQKTDLSGVYIIDLEPQFDQRGFFARQWSQDQSPDSGLTTGFVQCSISFNELKGTLRGMHFQHKPYEEVKIVRCTMGRMVDVILDIRPDSPTFKQWISVELSADNHKSVYISKGLAHGFQTLEDRTEVYYQISEYYHPESSGRVGWDDPEFNILWPISPAIISDADRGYIPFTRQDYFKR